MRTLCLALAILSSTAAPAFACSVVQDYHVPTSLELAERADTILVGTVTGERKGGGQGGMVLVRPTLLLKGRELPRQVELWGWLAKSGELVTRSDPDELRRPNPDALRGGCTRYVFARDMKLLLFFERKDGKLVFAGYPFARVSEDVVSDESRWVKAVRIYAAVAALPKEERRAALIARRDALRARRDDADAAAIADDIDQELAAERTSLRD
ncbi:hypothetical protein [Allosphingosinicella deserti]|uniref:Uncharacterized protein n=1 Tax=Allosphingosinicella deserti TaxID=2116704 RepID=A0A2P7QM54_9SPHN|nr:hypothetical protein [Sphingomonas deserti]PSJ39052.1 hypothetical protein C7I55_17305 [Sphingomonas deserti]